MREWHSECQTMHGIQWDREQSKITEIIVAKYNVVMQLLNNLKASNFGLIRNFERYFKKLSYLTTMQFTKYERRDHSSSVTFIFCY